MVAKLRCRVTKGMFRDEAVVEVADKAGRQHEFYVPSSEVEEDTQGNGRIKVSLYRRGDVQWAVLPTEYRDTFAVQEEDILVS